MSDALQERLLQVVQEYQERQKFWRMKFYNPYGWQEKFLAASSDCFQILAMTGNRCGKTYTGAYAMAVHLTGMYPEWWVGRRFESGIQAWAAGISTDTTRDILQSELLGQWNDPMKFGTGMIPKEAILETVNKPGVPGAFQSVLVQHVSGTISTLTFKSYEMSQDKFMGTSIHVVWLDEECPKDIFTQCVTRTATTGGIVFLTFTPEHGVTELVKDFMQELKPGQFMISASWDDAPHLDDKVKEQLLSVYSPAEREMRSRGVPMLGSGMVFPIDPKRIIIDPITIPDHWMRIIGIDLGFDHPNAVACVAWDNVTNTFYLYDEYSERGEKLSAHALAIRGKGGDTIPVVVPHDAFKKDSSNTGKQFIQLYADYGLNVIFKAFSNPPSADGKSSNSVEFGVNFMLQAMEEGRFKVFSTCTKFLQEMNMYHRDDGKIIDKHDDMISATRYAVLMAGRYARPGSAKNSGGYWYGNKPITPPWFDEIV